MGTSPCSPCRASPQKAGTFQSRRGVEEEREGEGGDHCRQRKPVGGCTGSVCWGLSSALSPLNFLDRLSQGQAVQWLSEHSKCSGMFVK